jgi:hypothetical protein
VPGWGQAVTLSGTTAYIAGGPNGFQVVSITDPASPILVRNVPTGGFVSVVKVDGDYLYVADVFGLSIFDISAPESPVKLSFTSSPSYDRNLTTIDYRAPSGIVVANHQVFMTNNDYGVGSKVQIDATDPAHPVSYQLSGTGGLYGLVNILTVINAKAAVCFQGTYAGTFYDHLVYAVLDVSVPGAPSVTSLNASSRLCANGGILTVSGSDLYFNSYQTGLAKYDVSDMNNPVLVASSPEKLLNNYIAYGQTLYATTWPNFSARQSSTVLRLGQVHSKFKVTGSITDPRFLLPSDAFNEGGASLSALATNGTYVVALREADLPPSMNGAVRTAAALFVIKF